MTMPIRTPTRRGIILGGGAALIGAQAARLQAQGPVRVAGIYMVPVGQQWVSRIHKAAEAAQAEGRIDYSFAENVANTDYPQVIRDHAEGGAKLILGGVFGAEARAREVAADNPGVAFLMGSSFLHNEALANFAVFDSHIQDATYLGGIIAGAMSASGRIGMVGGFAIPGVNRLMNAFMAGVRETRAEAEFQISFIGSWSDPPKAGAAALAMIGEGADVIYAERFGVAEAAREKGVLVIGNVTDTQADYPETVVTSALWHFGPTLDAALANVVADRFRAADYGVYSTMRKGGCSLSPLGTFEGKVPAEAMALVRRREAAIRAGNFTVTVNDSEPVQP